MARNSNISSRAVAVRLMAAGLCGAAGVTCAAWAAHAKIDAIGSAADMLLFHAPAFLALAGFRAATEASKIAAAGFGLLAVGILLFCGDVVLGAVGRDLFPMAAPIGGVALILGWCVIAVWGALRLRPRSDE